MVLALFFELTMRALAVRLSAADTKCIRYLLLSVSLPSLVVAIQGISAALC